MSRANTIILLLLAVLGVVFLLFIKPLITSTRDRQATEGYLVDIRPEEIRSVKITSGNETIAIKKRESGWKITKPGKDMASKEAVEKILAAAQNLQIQDALSEGSMRDSKLKLRDLGLANAKQSLELEDDGQKVQLIFGKDASGEKRIYMRRGDSEDAYIVSTELQDAAMRSLDDFRDKRLTNLDSDQISSFVIQRKAGDMELKRTGNRWEIVKPLRCPANADVITRFLDQILGAKILKIVSTGKEQNPQALGDTDMKLTLRPENSEDIVLQIGGQAAGNADAVLAWLSSRASLYELPKPAEGMLDLTPDDFRDKALLRMNSDVLDRIVIEKGGGKTELHRKGDHWISLVNGEEHLIPDSAVPGLLKILEEVPVERFIPATKADFTKFGVDKPAITLRLQSWLSENTPEEEAGGQDLKSFEFGKQEGEKLYVRIDGGQEVAVIPAGIEAFVTADPETWIDTPPKVPNAAPAKK